jgi:hypothetical protein
MGLFKSAGESPKATLPPLTRERIEAVMKRKDWRYSIDSDGDLTGLWDANVFYFFIAGQKKEILQVQSRWHKDLPINFRDEVLEEVNEWHRTRLWPKGYVRVDDKGRLWVMAEHIVDWEFGVTDDQLTLTINCAIATSLQLYQQMEEKFGNRH